MLPVMGNITTVLLWTLAFVFAPALVWLALRVRRLEREARARDRLQALEAAALAELIENQPRRRAFTLIRGGGKVGAAIAAFATGAHWLRRRPAVTGVALASVTAIALGGTASKPTAPTVPPQPSIAPPPAERPPDPAPPSTPKDAVPPNDGPAAMPQLPPTVDDLAKRRAQRTTATPPSSAQPESPDEGADNDSPTVPPDSSPNPEPAPVFCLRLPGEPVVDLAGCIHTVADLLDDIVS